MKTTMTTAALLAAIGCSDTKAIDKPAPIWIDGYAHQLVIKFTDDQRARLAGGKVDLATGDDDELASVLANHSVAVRPILRLDDAKLDAIGGLSSESTDLRGIYTADRSAERDATLAAATALLALDAVEYVYLEPLEVPPPGDLAPVTESYVARQTYRGTE